MSALVRYNRRWLGALLVVAFAMMATASGASWQCPDGRPCPPACKMHEAGWKSAPDAGLPPCCRMGQHACPLCPSGPRLTIPAPGEGCSSATCVLRFSHKPDALTPTGTHATTALAAPALLPAPATLEATPRPALPVAPRTAPPPRSGGTPPPAPRGPPSLLG